MALPAGVSTAVVTVGVPVTFTGNTLKTNITITPSAFLVHTATGHPLVNMIEEATANDGVAVQFTLPHTDQAGFQDEAGNAYQNWYYTATIQYQQGKVTKPAFTKVFQLAVGQTTVDLDLLPSGSPAMPYTAPVATVTSVNGQNGAITVEESTDAGVAAFVQGSGPTATALNATFLPDDPATLLGQVFGYDPSKTGPNKFRWFTREDHVARALGYIIGTDPAYGMVGDAVTLADAAVTSGAAVLTSASASFVSGDVGKRIVVAGAGASGALLKTTILSVQNATTATLAANASVTVSAAKAVYGTNDTAAFVSAALAAAAAKKILHLPAGKTYLVDPVTIGADNVKISGYGASLLSTLWSTDNSIGLYVYGNNLEFRGFSLAVAVTYDTNQAGFSNYDLMRVGGQIGGAYKSGVIVEDCTLTGGAGLNAYKTSHVRITNNSVTKSHGNSIGAVSCIEDVVIEKNYASNGNDDLIAVTADAGTGQSTTRVVVQGNNLDTTDASAIKIAGADRVTVVANEIRNTFTAAIMVLQDTVFSLQPSHRVVIIGNTVQDGGQCFGTGRYHPTASTAANAIQVTSNSADCIIADNILTNSLNRAISIPLANAGITITENRIIGAGGAGINVGDVADSTFGKAVDLLIADNMIRNVQGGIAVGSVTTANIHDNIIRSYSNGLGTGYRGIQYGYLKNAKISNNIIINDDGGGATTFDSAPGQSINLRMYGNEQIASATQTDGVNVFTIGGVRIGFASAQPTTGTWAAGDRVFNLAPAAGAVAGWVCATAGTATATAWAVSTAYTVGQIVYNGTNAYQVTTAGTSASSGGPTGTGSSITDNTVTWQYLSARAVFVQMGNDGAPAAPQVAGVVLQRTKTGGFIAPPTAARGTVTPALNRLFAYPITLSQAVTAVSFNLKVTTLGSADATAKVGLWADDGTTNPTGSPLAAASITGLDTTGIKTAAISVALQPGTYWLFFVVQGATTMPVFSGTTGQIIGLPAVADPAATVTSLNADSQSGAITTPPGMGAYTAPAPLVTLGI